MSMSYPLVRRIQYLIRRSATNLGVTQGFIKKVREDVQELLGPEAFSYLERHLDARDGRWEVSSGFSWVGLLNSRPRTNAELKARILAKQKEARILAKQRKHEQV